MCSATSSEGPRLVRIAVPCAHADKGGHRDAFSNNMLERMTQSAAFFKRPAQPCRLRATKPRAKRETRSALCHSVVVDSTLI